MEDQTTPFKAIECSTCRHIGESNELPDDRCYKCIRSVQITNYWEDLELSTDLDIMDVVA